MKRLLGTWMLLVVGVAAGMAQTTVSGEWKNTPIAEVFQDMGRQGGVEFAPWPVKLWEQHEPQKINAVLQTRGFWDGTLEVARSSKLRIVPVSLSGQDRRVRVIEEKSTPEPTWVSRPVISGPMTLVLEAMPMGGLELVAYADPGCRDFVFAGEVELTEATNRQGESLLQEHKKQLPPAPAMITRHALPVKLGVGAGETDRVRGSFTMLMASKVEEWKIANPIAAAKTTRQCGRYTYTFGSLVKKDGQYELQLSTKGPSNGGFKSQMQNLMVGEQALLAVDAAGGRWRITQIAGNYLAKEMTGLSYCDYTLKLAPENPANSGEIASLSWRLPLEVSNVNVPFDFQVGAQH